MNIQRNKLIDRFIVSNLKLKRCVEHASNVSIEEKIATMLQMHALEYLKENSGATVGELTDYLSLSASSTAQLTDRLVASSWIKRRNDESDRRVVRLVLTGEGKRELSRMKEKRIKKMNRIFSFVPDSDLNEMVRIQNDLIAKLNSNKIR